MYWRGNQQKYNHAVTYFVMFKSDSFSVRLPFPPPTLCVFSLSIILIFSLSTHLTLLCRHLSLPSPYLFFSLSVDHVQMQLSCRTTAVSL